MASMFSNVLGYLCPKGQDADHPLRSVPNVNGPDSGEEENTADCNLIYGIEDQDDWQIVRKMSDASSSTTELEDCLDDGSGEALFALDEEDDTGMEEDTENRRPGGRACPNSWYLAPPPCFTRSAPSPSTNPLENLLIEHPSMSVYLLPLAASSSTRRGGALYRSAPPLIMEEHFAGPSRSASRRSSAAGSPARRTATPPGTPEAAPTGTTTVQRVLHSKRKRRVRAQRHAGTLVSPTAGSTGPAAPTRTAAPNPTPRDLGIHTADEEDKQLQVEEKDQRTGRKLLAKNQLQRGNLLPEVTGPKKRSANRDGNYRCLH